jgi:hypothetical protein
MRFSAQRGINDHSGSQDPESGSANKGILSSMPINASNSSKAEASTGSEIGALIFLDIDGPMIPWGPTADPFLIPREKFPYVSRFSPRCVQLMKDLCEDRNARIVANTTHNGGGVGDWTGEIHIKTLFELNGLGKYLLSRTHYRSDIDYVGNRAVAVNQWLNSNPQYSDIPWVAFDDETVDFEDWNTNLNGTGLRPMWLVPAPLSGITEKEISLAKNIFDGIYKTPWDVYK